MRERRLRIVRPLGRASDAQLVVGVAQHNTQALQELSHRHSAALSVLACAMVRQPASARRVVAAVFASLWAEPERVEAEASVRAHLAGMVSDECRGTEVEPVRNGGDQLRLVGPEGATTARPERVAVALIAFGDHTCEHAAARVGLRPAVVADRLRAFVLDPDHFAAYCSTADNTVALRSPRPRR
jgi:hypothetical protein